MAKIVEPERANLALIYRTVVSIVDLGYAVPTGPVGIQKKGIVLNFTSRGQPMNPATGAGVRYPVSGEVGSRNNYRGGGYFGIDSGLQKTWHVTGGQQLALACEVFNASNSVRFDTNPATFQNSFNPENFGTYGATMTPPRIQRLSLRYGFWGRAEVIVPSLRTHKVAIPQRE